MGDTLFGKTETHSGTPLETEDATARLGGQLNEMLRSGGQYDPFGRMRSSALQRILGFDPGNIGLEGTVESVLTDPRDATAGLFAAMRPFEERAANQAAAGVRTGFGDFGARFSRSAADLESQTRGELASQFAKTREEALLGANAQRINALGQILGASNAAANTAEIPISQILQFLRPGERVITNREGIAGDLLGAAGNIAGARFLR